MNTHLIHNNTIAVAIPVSVHRPGTQSAPILVDELISESMSSEQIATGAKSVRVEARNVGGISEMEIDFEPGETILTVW